MTELLAGPIADRHRALGATFAAFGGWDMPVSYAGTVAEHHAVREAVGIFDVSHLGKALVTGPGAAGFVNATLTNDLARIHPGKAQYTLCCNESGGVIDDLIAYLVADDEVFLVPNAANTAKVVAALKSVAPQNIQIEDQHRDYAVFAVQGPKSADVLAALGLPADIEYMAFADADLRVGGTDYPVRICRTGYTGERGYEILPRWAHAGPVFDALLAEVTNAGGQPAGLGARDTLRTEMGYALHGHELSEQITPIQARVGWAVGWDKPAFFGREALLAEKQAGPARRLYGLAATGRGVPRADLAVLSLADGRSAAGGSGSGLAGEKVGVCTSGTFSPTLKKGIALALIDTASGISAGAEVVIDVRGRALPCEVVIPPFVASHV
ncbi:MAG: glycine cleavage system aminomethyltransferase GcvT [Gordonia sp. (in: high G+C Gram-positive bacteria)]